MRVTSKSKDRPKFQYSVIIDNCEYHTWAYNKEGALSNAAYRFGKENDMDVKLVMWKIRNGELVRDVEVEE